MCKMSILDKDSCEGSMKRGWTEKSFRVYLDLLNPRGIEMEHSWYKDAWDFQKRSNTTFRTMYNEWIDSAEKDGFDTGCYPKWTKKEVTN